MLQFLLLPSLNSKPLSLPPQFPSLINGHMPVPLPNLEGTPSSLLLSPATHKSWSRVCEKRRKKKNLHPSPVESLRRHHQSQQHGLLFKFRFRQVRGDGVCVCDLTFFFCTWVSSDFQWLKALGESHSATVWLWPFVIKIQHIMWPHSRWTTVGRLAQHKSHWCKSKAHKETRGKSIWVEGAAQPE